ncbi:MAG: poly(R)-hydroxyalkanoic acid synthase subunit PhaE, partial [Burkholderiales bacterium]
TSGWSKVIEGVGKRLGEMRASGERVESLVDLVRLWAGVAEKTLHEAMQSKPGLDATAEYLRAALRYRQQQNRLVEILSGLLNVPARSEVDDAYLEIQTLKRQVRALQREVRTLSNPSRSARRKSEERSRGESS